MDKKAQQPLTIIGSVILFIAVAAVLLIGTFSFLGPIQQGFSGSICKFEVALRSILVGNPIMQMLAGTFNFFTRGWTTITAGLFSGLDLQSCPSGLSLKTTNEKPITDAFIADILLKKIGDESARCWDLFGAGAWDSLLFSREGLLFTCWKDEVHIVCSPEQGEIISQVVISGILKDYLSVNEYSFGSYSELYYDIFPNSMPILGLESTPLTCDGTIHEYLFVIYFVDKIAIQVTSPLVSLLCDTVNVQLLGSDAIYLCMLDITPIS